jgi:hypothetical protein
VLPWVGSGGLNAFAGGGEQMVMLDLLFQAWREAEGARLHPIFDFVFFDFNLKFSLSIFMVANEQP